MQDPIRVNVIGADFKTQYSVVIVGQIPEKAQKALEAGKPDEATMKPVFGPRWKEKLFLAPKKGGSDEAEAQQEQREAEQEQRGEAFVATDEEITLDDIASFAEDAHEVEAPIQPAAGSTVYSFVNIFPFDTILEVKRKLEYITKIPIYRQHLNYFYSKRYYACNYTILYKRLVYHPDIFELKNGDKNRVEGIPVDQKFINLAKVLRVKAFDFANVMQELLTKFDAFEYNLFDMEAFLTPKTRTTLHKTANSTQLNILYYGFVLIYFPMMTYPVFMDYIKLDERDFRIRYSQLFNDSDYGRFLKMEAQLTYQNFALAADDKRQKLLQTKMVSGIERGTIQVFTNYKEDAVVHIRSLFDVIELSDQVVACAATLLNEGNRYFLTKTYKKHPGFKLMPEINNIIFRIKYNTTTTESFTIMLNRNGNYFITSSFLEEHLYNFQDIVTVLAAIVNPFIDRINKLAKYVLIGANRIEHMTYANAKFIEVKSFIIWKGVVSDENFNRYSAILNDFARAQIITMVETGPMLNKYYYNKGVYQLDIGRIEKNIEVVNHYGFLSDPIHKHVFDNLFRHNRVIYVENRSFDMRISIEGLRDKEYSIYQSYMYLSLALFMEAADFSVEQRTSKPIKNVRSLKSQDPVLYSFKKLYNSPIPYSKICQKPFQPVILDSGDKGAKDTKTVKFWNFTTKSSVYYRCPNPKYPHLTFIVGKHPKGYCIPCCKKIAAEQSRAKSSIYKTCLEKYEYTDERTHAEARYIPNYGKPVEAGRLSQLPVQLRNLFFNTYTTVVVPDSRAKLYVYGVPQKVAGVPAPLLSTLVIAMEQHLADLVEEIGRHIHKKPEMFNVLLNGKIYLHFSSAKDLSTAIFETFVSRQLGYEHVPWNDIFRDIAFYYLGVNVVTFVDHGEGNISMDVVPNVISDIDIRSVKKHLLMITRAGSSNPLFMLDANAFFTNGVLHKKLLEPEDIIIDVVAHVMKWFYNTSSRDSEMLQLDDIYRFAEYSKDFSIKGVFVSKTNMCYMVHLVKKGEGIYIPVSYIYYNISSNLEVHYKPFCRKSAPNKMALLNDFLYEYNRWMVAENKKYSRFIEYKSILVDYWLVHGGKVIGFNCKGLNFYVGLELAAALKLKAAPVTEVLYDPDVINAVIAAKPAPSADHLTANLYRNLYHYHGYELFVSELMYYFHSKHNEPIRRVINEQIEQRNQKGLDVIYEKLLEMYMGFYKPKGEAKKGELSQIFEKIQIKDARLAKIHKTEDVDVEVFNRFRIFLTNDINRLELQINSYLEEYISKADLLNLIKNTDYTFDFTDIHLLKNLPFADAFRILQKIAANVFSVKKSLTSVKEAFPNMYISCQAHSKEAYCDGSKLVVETERYDDFLHIFLQDIQNPLKEQWIINMLYKDNVFDFFEFIYRKNESISISY